MDLIWDEATEAERRVLVQEMLEGILDVPESPGGEGRWRAEAQRHTR
jgi:hypothetical protein